MAAKRSRPNASQARSRRKPTSRISSTGTRSAQQVTEPKASDNWTFLSNHSHVLVALTRNPHQSLREVSMQVGITERSVQRIVTDLEEAGYLVRKKVGRNNQYSINEDMPLRHALERHCDVGELLDLIVESR